MRAFQTTAVLPPLYARWIDALLGDPVPPETRSTCEDCAMCAPPGETPDPGIHYFSPRVKCCSYQPRLPNFLVGRILEDSDFSFSEGRSTVERRIDAGVGVSPLGLDQSKKYGVLYKHGLAGFGRAESLRCPHFIDEGGGRCGIWRNRNSVCTTWFCKHERGGVGLEFWSRVRELLSAIETDLAVWCVVESDLGLEQMETVFPTRRRPNETDGLTVADVDGVADPKLARGLWGRWLGREREYYVACAERVSPLAWKEVERIASPSVIARARLVRKAFEAMKSPGLPERLTAGEFQVVSTRQEGVRVVGYSATDPLELTRDVFDILPYFDGRPLDQTLRAIRMDLGLEVEKDLIRKLADFEILAEPRTV
ncbi:MAG TPA: hypothetical protein VF376_04505 [Thermoanaerobaculia bacterium]